MLNTSVNNAKFMILDLNGRMVRDGTFQGVQAIIPVQGLAPGAYQFRLHKGPEYLSRHFRVE